MERTATLNNILGLSIVGRASQKFFYASDSPSLTICATHQIAINQYSLYIDALLTAINRLVSLSK
mgnify:FL=1